MRTAELEKSNLKIIRICNIDIDDNFYGVCEYIDRAVKNSVSV
jgi:very-short-patch-repair endonuclease